jgi:hypothetical protein
MMFLVAVEDAIACHVSDGDIALRKGGSASLIAEWPNGRERFVQVGVTKNISIDHC